MTTEKYFELQIFADKYPEDVKIKNSDGNVAIEGVESTETSTASAAESIAAAIIEANYSPTEGAVVNVDDIEYTYNGENWTYDEATNAEDQDAIVAAYLLENIAEGDVITVDDIEYTYNGENWTFEQTENADDADAVNAAYLAENLAEGDTVTVDDIEYTYDGENWTYEDNKTADDADAVNAAYLAENLGDGDSVTVDEIEYTYNGENWTFEQITDADDQDAIANAYLAENLGDGDVVTVDEIEYTYNGENWTFEETKNVDVDYVDTIIAQYLAENLSDGDTFTVDETEYTFDGENWTFEDTKIADTDTVQTIINEFVTDNLQMGDVVTVEETDYTLTTDGWAYEETKIADSDTVQTIIAEFVTDNLQTGETVTVEDTEYTLGDDGWSYVVTETATNETESAILDEYYTPADGDTFTYQDTEYTYDAANETWTLDGAAVDADLAINIFAAYLFVNINDGDEQTLGDVTYTVHFDNGEYIWTYTDTAIADADTVEQIIAVYVLENLQTGETVTVDETEYTLTTDGWEYLATEYATPEVVEQIIAVYVLENLQTGETVTVDETEYTLTADGWEYLATEIAEDQGAIRLAYLEENLAEGETVTVDDIEYTLGADGWTYIATENADDQDAINAAYLAETLAADDVITVDEVEYTYDGDNWTYLATETADDTDAIVAAYLAENLSADDTITVDEIEYTYDGENWIYEETEIAGDTDAIVAAYLAENLSADDTITVDETEYTYDGEYWTYLATEIAEDVDAISAEYLAENLNAEDTVTVDEVEYTYDGENWTYIATLDASEESSAAAAAQFVDDNLSNGDTQTYEDVEYTYDGEEWTYPTTVTTYYQFADTVSSAAKPVDIVTATRVDDEEAENTSISAPVYIAGGNEYVDGAVIDGVGTISGLDNDEYVQIAAEDGKVVIADAEGAFELVAAEKSTAIGDTTFKTAKGEVLELSGDGTGVLAIAADDVTVDAFGADQVFIVDEDKSLTYGKVEYTGAGADDVTLTNDDTETAYINATINEGESGLQVAKSGSRSNRVDQIDVNGALISGAADVAAVITANESGIQVAANDTGEIAVADDSAELAAGSNALITGTGDDAAISAINALKAGGKWITNQDAVTLGANTQVWNFSETGEVTITADKDTGATASKVEFNAGTATVTESNSNTLTANDININGAATWDIVVTNNDTPVDEGLTFDVDGNATLNSDDESNLIAVVGITAGKDKTFTNANTGDTIKVTKGDILSVHGFNDSIIASEFSDWTVKTNAAVVGLAFADQQTLQVDSPKDAEYKAIVSSNNKRNAFGEISDLAGDATISYGSDTSISGLKVADKTWTISGDDDRAVLFDTDGNASVSGDAVVIGDADAVVTVVGGEEAVVNKTTVDASDDADGVVITLEEGGHNSGIATISGVDVGSNIEISGDNSFVINEYTFGSSSRNDADIYVGDTGMVYEGVANNDDITLSGDERSSFDFVNSITGDITVTLNGVGISVDAGDDSGRSLYVSAEKDDISRISGVKLEDTITTSKDDSFDVSYYDSSKSAFEVGDAIIINDMSIEMVNGTGTIKDNFVSISADNTNGTANVELTGIAFGDDDTLKVSKGTYKIGKSAAVTVNESVGYITFDSLGNAEAEDGTAHDNREDREKAAEDAMATSTTVDAFKVYYGTEELPSAVENSTTAGFENAKTAASEVKTSASEAGINIYGDVSLGSNKLSAVTLQSFVAEDINIVSEINDDNGLRTAVIDVANGQNTMVAITADNAVNHTVNGSNNKSTLVIGENAKGNNYIQAGSVGSYLFNASSAASTLLGGAGADTIIAGEHDYVMGNGGADNFYDMNGTDSDTKGYVIQDYSLADGDVIVGTKLSEVRGNLNAETLAAKLEVTDKTIAIAGGPTMTIQTAEGDFAQAIIMADSSAEIKHNVVWAKESGGVLDTSAFGESTATFMLANKNGMADSITGSSGNDTIFAGGNDTVNPNGGHDEIYLTAAETGSMEQGAVVVMNGDKGGRHFVNNWNFGFEDTEGDNILNISSNLYFEVQHDSLIAFSGNDTLSFVGSDTIDTDRFDILVGTPENTHRVSVLKSGTNVVVENEDDLGIYYYAVGSNSSIKFAEDIGTIDEVITLGSTNYESIAHMVLANEGTATVIGDSVANEVVELTGSAANDARKSVSLGGGNDSIISTGSDTALAGNNIYFSKGDGNDVISNFAYYQGFAADPEADAADVLLLDGTGAESSIIADANNIELRIDNQTKLNLSGEVNADNMLRYRISGGREYVAKIGISEGQNNTFTYNDEVDVYNGNTHILEDTLKVAEDNKQVDIWLDNQHNKSFTGIGVVDASDATNTRVVIAGAEYINNTLIGGGEGSRSSLWGGAYHDASGAMTNELIGGAGEDTFYYMKGQTSQDTISNMDADKDKIMLFGMTLDDISETSVTDSSVSLKFKSGGSITVNDATDGTSVLLLENGQYQEYTTEAGNEATGGWKKTQQ